MKVAIASQGNTLNHTIDLQFGHCAYFVLYDKQTGGLEISPNPPFAMHQKKQVFKRLNGWLRKI